MSKRITIEPHEFEVYLAEIMRLEEIDKRLRDEWRSAKRATPSAIMHGRLSLS